MTTVCVVGLVPLFATAADATKEPQRLRRADSFLGVHFDFHAREDCTAVGSNTTPAMVANMLDQVRPDYIQIQSDRRRKNAVRVKRAGTV